MLKKCLTGPTLLEMSGNATNQELAVGATDDPDSSGISLFRNGPSLSAAPPPG